MKTAITGSIGSGKSTVSALIRNRGFHVFDCDAYNAFLLEEGQEGWIRVKEAFPEAFTEGGLDKKKLAALIFGDTEKREELEGLLHPLIIDEMCKETDEYDPFFAEVPLLFENGLERYFDCSLLIVCAEDIALSRLIDRGLSREEAQKRLASQMSVEKKILRADEIIYNNGNLSELENKVDKWLDKHVR